MAVEAVDEVDAAVIAAAAADARRVNSAVAVPGKPMPRARAKDPSETSRRAPHVNDATRMTKGETRGGAPANDATRRRAPRTNDAGSTR